MEVEEGAADHPGLTEEEEEEEEAMVVAVRSQCV